MRSGTSWPVWVGLRLKLGEEGRASATDEPVGREGPTDKSATSSRRTIGSGGRGADGEKEDGELAGKEGWIAGATESRLQQLLAPTPSL